MTGKGAPSVESPLNTKKIESFCAQHTSKSTIDSVDDWIRCQRKAAEAAASSKMAAKFPDAPNVMEKMKNAISSMRTTTAGGSLLLAAGQLLSRVTSREDECGHDGALQRPEKPRHKLRAKGPRSCTIFARECP